MKLLVNKKRIWIIALLTTVLVLSATFFLLTACNSDDNIQNSPYFIKLEAEKGLFVSDEGATGTEKYSVANSKSENITSEGKFVSALKNPGDRLIWVIMSDNNVNTDLYIAAANAAPGAGDFILGGGNVINARINESSVSIAATKINAASEYCDAWQLIKINSVPIKAGYNYFEVEISDTENLINIDYLGIYAKNVAIQEHSHAASWTTYTKPATCDEAGRIDRTCSDCGISYHYLNIQAIGHNFSSFHYDENSGKMMQACENCGDKKYANAPNSKYFGEVFENKSQFSIQKPVKTVYEAEDAYVNTSGGLNHGTSYIEYNSGSGNGAHVANISNLGNYIEFRVHSSAACKADLVLVLANVLYTSSGIGLLSPMSNYVSFLINGQPVDFSYVDFPGDANYNYYNWRYVVMKDIDLQEGLNLLVLSPKSNRNSITIPNTDALYLYTNEDCLTIKYIYGITDVLVDNDFISSYKTETAFAEAGGEFYLKAGALAKGDIVITLHSNEVLGSIGNRLTLKLGGKWVDTENLSLSAGDNKLVIKDFSVALGFNKISYTARNGISVTAARIFTDGSVHKAYASEVDDSYNYFVNAGTPGAKTPGLIYEAESADLGNSVSSTGNPIIGASNTASGGGLIESFGTTGNSITWRISADTNFTADIAIRMACANWNAQIHGNENMADLSRFITITVDGIEFDLSGVDLECSGPNSWTDWTTVVAKNIELEPGGHTIVMECKSYSFPNTDVLYIYTDNEVNIEKHF